MPPRATPRRGPVPPGKTKVDINPVTRIKVDINPVARIKVDINPVTRIKVDINPKTAPFTVTCEAFTWEEAQHQ